MTAKERRALFRDLRKFGVAEWSDGTVRIVFAPEAPALNRQPRLGRVMDATASEVQGPKQQSLIDQSLSAEGRRYQAENPYQELASAVGLDWHRISGQHAGETD